MPLSAMTFRKLVLPLAQRHAMARLDLGRSLAVDQRFRFPRPRHQDAALLERLADRGDAEAERRLVEPLAAGIEFRPRNDLLVTGINAAAGEHQRAGAEIDLIMANHHEDFDFVTGGSGCAVTQQEDRGRRTRRDSLSHPLARRAGLRLQVGALVETRNPRQEIVDFGARGPA